MYAREFVLVCANVRACVCVHLHVGVLESACKNTFLKRMMNSSVNAFDLDRVTGPAAAVAFLSALTDMSTAAGPQGLRTACVCVLYAEQRCTPAERSLFTTNALHAHTAPDSARPLPPPLAPDGGAGSSAPFVSSLYRESKRAWAFEVRNSGGAALFIDLCIANCSPC